MKSSCQKDQTSNLGMWQIYYVCESSNLTNNETVVAKIDSDIFYEAPTIPVPTSFERPQNNTVSIDLNEDLSSVSLVPATATSEDMSLEIKTQTNKLNIERSLEETNKQINFGPTAINSDNIDNLSRTEENENRPNTISQRFHDSSSKLTDLSAETDPESSIIETLPGPESSTKTLVDLDETEEPLEPIVQHEIMMKQNTQDEINSTDYGQAFETENLINFILEEHYHDVSTIEEDEQSSTDKEPLQPIVEHGLMVKQNTKDEVTLIDNGSIAWDVI